MFATRFASHYLNQKFGQLMDDINNDNFDLLDICHHFSSGMKGVFTQDGFDGCVQIRQALGGAGYSAWSGLPRLVEDYSPMVTFEGDNTVMCQ